MRTTRFAPDLALIALATPPLGFAIGAWTVLDAPRFEFLLHPASWPWELWTLAVAGTVATAAGVMDWCYHRRHDVRIPPNERRSERWALVTGGVPLFALLACASVSTTPLRWLIPVWIVALWTAVLISYDEFVFHRRRCKRLETLFHRGLVFGHAVAFLAWSHWCFVRTATA